MADTQGQAYPLGNERSTHCPNIWLEDKYLPGFRAYALDFQATCRKLQMMALRALAIGMPHVPDGFFEEYHDAEDNQLRLLHCEYPRLNLTSTGRADK